MALVLRFWKIWGVLRYLKIVKSDLQLAAVVGEGRVALNKAIEGHIPLLSMAHWMACVLRVAILSRHMFTPQVWGDVKIWWGRRC